MTKSELKLRIKQMHLEDLQSKKRLDAEVNGHIIPRLMHITTHLSNDGVVNENIMLAVAALEELSC